MSTKSNDLGRAYEYRWIKELEHAIQAYRPVQIERNSSLDANHRAWDQISVENQETLLLSAKAAVKSFLLLEPSLLTGKDQIQLIPQEDRRGIEGDVRDIVLLCPNTHWEVGLSIKHNNEALKHSRISHKLDFGDKWYGIPCSGDYWNSIRDIFSLLQEEKEKKVMWSKLPKKKSVVYFPLLQAVMQEIHRAYKKSPVMLFRLVEYLLGTKDYYKIISRDSERQTHIEAFNMHHTLNSQIPSMSLPTSILSLEMKPSSKTTFLLKMDKGWTISFRIHNSSEIVQPSLKLDIKFVDMPSDIPTFCCQWD